MRPAAGLLAAAALLMLPAGAAGQSFGLGARMSMIRADVDSETGGERFTGGHLRAWMSPRTAFELALDRRTETSDDGTERVRDTPLQASLLLTPVKAAIAPYLLGGGGWYTTRVETLQDQRVVSSRSAREFGWHGGFGAELRFGRHAAAHADYRYTFLDFGDDEGGDGPGAESGDEGSRFLPSYRGSMWTAGFTLYF